jgi:ABC-type multidrug transport system fused ATPase/permease subunit
LSQEYSSIEPEAALEGPQQPPAQWPAEGHVELRDLVVSYREGLEPVLKGLSVAIEPRQKIGVCGRTGAG